MDTRFIPSQHGFPFANTWPIGQPVLKLWTPFGRIGIGNAAAGVCGGMVFAALDHFYHDRPVPPEPTDELFRYLVRRLFASWNIPFGGARYYDWQRRPDLHRFTLREWQGIRDRLDAGTPVPLGLVQVQSWDLRQVGRNHQVLAVGYDIRESGTIAIRIYDPNYPGDDETSLLFDPNVPGQPIRHSWEGGTVRGFFRTRYQVPRVLPRLV